ncbi:MAG: CRISPR-associated endonuclease Cas3'', partial [Caldilineaceae bacterium]|nr:CRISPR-associated endonuclease Cas3'' [Caldilineaceae bacterium]
MRKPFAEGLTRAASEVKAQEQDAQQEQVFAQLVQSWLEQTPVRIYHTKLHGARRDYVVHPYHIEPSMWNDGNYLIGYSEYHKKNARFKIARIDKVVITGGKFREETEFDIHHFLQHAWGIWSTDEEPVTVRLRFRKWAIPRLTETVWPNATLTDPAEDGSRVWEMPVAEWREMLPWVRSWGSDVEVLAPVELREVIVADVNRLADRYNVKAQPPKERLLWAKTDSNGNTHPLICHLIDVGQVALLLWNQVLTDAFRLQIARALDVDVAAAGRLFAFWSACHDLGKASPNFQRKYEPSIATLKAAGFTFPTILGDPKCYHATISALILPTFLWEETKLPEELAGEVAQALGGHHGSWPNNAVRRQHRGQIGDGGWQKAQLALVRQLIDLFNPPTITRLGVDRAMQNTVLVLLSGLTSVADWMGSMSEYFIFSTPYVEPAVYLEIAQRRAQRVLERLGWLDWQLPTELLDFQALHGFLPRPTQAAVLDCLPGDDGPCLVIAEMLTGSGKTELA